jgi:hypothetical protein
MTDELMLPGYERTLREIEAAADLDMPGLEADGARASPWPDMTRVYETIARAVAACAGEGNPAARALDARFRGHAGNLRLAAAIGRADWGRDRDSVPADVGAEGAWPAAPHRSASVDLARRRIGAALENHFDDPGLDEGPIVDLAEAVLNFLLRAQDVLRLASEAPRDIDPHSPLQGVAQRRLACLIGEIESAFGLVIDVDEVSLSVRPAPRIDAARAMAGEV